MFEPLYRVNTHGLMLVPGHPGHVQARLGHQLPF